MKTKKPTVRYYRDSLRFFHSMALPDRELANVFAIDHPRLGTSGVTTSKVISKGSDGQFETENTLYVACDDTRPEGDFTPFGSGEERCNQCGMILWALSGRLSRHYEGCNFVATFRRD